MKHWKNTNIELHYPKKIGNSFDMIIAEEEFNDFQFPISCKRCGEEFIRKQKNQKFCSRECRDKYRSKIFNLKNTRGKEFLNWLKDKI